MGTLTVRNLPEEVVVSLKGMARRRNCSMEQLVRDILTERAASREALLREVEALWTRRQGEVGAEEIDGWIEAGRRGRS